MSASGFDIQLLVHTVSSLAFNGQVLVGALVVWIFSWLWHDHIVVKPWLRWTNMTLQDASALHEGKLAQHLGIYLVNKIVLSYFCMLLMVIAGAGTILEVLLLGTLISIGAVFAAGVGPVIFENRHVGLWLLSGTLLSLSVFLVLFIRLFCASFIGE